MNKITISREVLFEIFVLCLFWEWNPDRLTHAYSTGGKVLRILKGLGVITDSQEKYLPDENAYLSLFAIKGSFLYTQTHFVDRNGTKRDWVLGDKKPILIQVVGRGKINRRRILRDYRIYLTHVGASLAKGLLEEKYAPLINREKYLEEVKKQQEELSLRAIPVVMKRYRIRVKEEARE